MPNLVDRAGFEAMLDRSFGMDAPVNAPLMGVAFQSSALPTSAMPLHATFEFGGRQP